MFKKVTMTALATMILAGAVFGLSRTGAHAGTLNKARAICVQKYGATDNRACVRAQYWQLTHTGE